LPQLLSAVHGAPIELLVLEPPLPLLPPLPLEPEVPPVVPPLPPVVPPLPLFVPPLFVPPLSTLPLPLLEPLSLLDFEPPQALMETAVKATKTKGIIGERSNVIQLSKQRAPVK
jgi:hypothetical protein